MQIEPYSFTERAALVKRATSSARWAGWLLGIAAVCVAFESPRVAAIAAIAAAAVLADAVVRMLSDARLRADAALERATAAAETATAIHGYQMDLLQRDLVDAFGRPGSPRI